VHERLSEAGAIGAGSIGKARMPVASIFTKRECCPTICVGFGEKGSWGKNRNGHGTEDERE
jgi:hypothetical protein